QALKGFGAFFPAAQRPWSHELSGRIASLAADIVNEAEVIVAQIRQNFINKARSVPSKIVFTGVACATAAELRTTGPLPTDAIYTPDQNDLAHSDFVTYRTINDGDLDPVRERLRQTLRVLKPQDIPQLMTSCGVTATAASPPTRSAG